MPTTQQDQHRREERPALAAVADHPPEGVGERGRDQQDQQQLDEVGRAPVGFSNGMAQLTLKKPPPLVPSCLIATCEATGPSARVWPAAGERRAASSVAAEGLDHALGDEDQGADDRERQQDVEQDADQVAPEVAERRAAAAAKPRITAASTAMPTAAETKFWTASPAIWAK